MKQNPETVVGIFLMAGIAVICTLIIFFGEVQGLFKPTYNLTVRFENASGLLKGSDVYLSGALIGKVTTNPVPIPDTQQVEVHLKIDSNVKIRKDASYVIGSSGLLGDMYVEVRPHVYPSDVPESERAAYVEDGAIINGETNPSLNDLAKGAEPLINKANDIASQLDDMITRLNQDVLSGTSTADLKETIAKLRDMVNNGDSMVKHADEFLVQAKNSKGTIGLLMNDRKTAENLSAFVANLREHGPLFYHDDSSSGTKTKKDKK